MALSAARNTQAFNDGRVQRMSVPQKDATTIYAGSLVVFDAGYAAPGATATGLYAIGRAVKTQANAAGDGAVSIDVETDMAFLWDNSAGDALATANIGALCYIEDDHTVSATDGTGSQSAAGRFLGFVGSLCIVKMGIGVV